MQNHYRVFTGVLAKRITAPIWSRHLSIDELAPPGGTWIGGIPCWFSDLLDLPSRLLVIRPFLVEGSLKRALISPERSFLSLWM